MIDYQLCKDKSLRLVYVFISIFPFKNKKKEIYSEWNSIDF